MYARQPDNRLVTRWWRGLLAATVLLAGIGLTGCEPAADDGDNGELIIGITDAQGDFLNYTVSIGALSLTKANGAVVEALPLSTELDFSQYTQMTEILTAATVPAGVYVQASMTLNYRNADIQVEDAMGEAVQVENIVDADGNAVTELEVRVHLGDRDRLVIRPGIPAHMTLDFDLKASNAVRFDDQGEPTVTVEPFLIADVELSRPKIQRVRGPLRGVNLDRSSYSVIIRPFRHDLRGDHRRFGTLTVLTNDDTVFDIDNQMFTGTAGLEELAAQPALTATVAIGELKGDPRRFQAREVYAGSSVPGGDLDVVQGTVLARELDTLTVRGATLMRRDGSIAFNDNVTVILADSTVVRKQFSADEHDIDDISPGQRVRVFGTLSDTADLQLDASNGYARMLLSVLHGTRTDDPALTDQELVVDLQSMNRRRVELYDFTGTGMTPADDAAEDSYEIDTATLDLSEIGIDSPLQVRGFATPFGSAPADYEAQTVVDLGALRAVLGMSWDPASSEPFTALSETGLTLNLAGAGAWHHVFRGGFATDLGTLATPASIAPGADGDGIFVVQQQRSVQVHTRFSAFSADLDARLAAGGAVRGLRASGVFDDQSATLTARTVWVSMR